MNANDSRAAASWFPPCGWRKVTGYFETISIKMNGFLLRMACAHGIDPIFFSKDSWTDEIDENARHWIITQNNINSKNNSVPCREHGEI
jgi:hypothetical protein